VPVPESGSNTLAAGRLVQGCWTVTRSDDRLRRSPAQVGLIYGGRGDHVWPGQRAVVFFTAVNTAVHTATRRRLWTGDADPRCDLILQQTPRRACAVRLLGGPSRCGVHSPSGRTGSGPSLHAVVHREGQCDSAAPARCPTSGWGGGCAAGRGASEEQPGNDRVGVPHLAQAELVAPPGQGHYQGPGAAQGDLRSRRQNAPAELVGCPMGG
jgi:hypothetical protein